MSYIRPPEADVGCSLSAQQTQVTARDIDLTGEMREAQRRLRPRHRAHLLDLGIPAHVIDYGPTHVSDYGLIGVERVAVEDGLYQPHPSGELVYLVAVRVDPVSPECIDHELTPFLADIVDLLALRPSQPDRWALRIGSAEWLGACAPQHLDPDPTMVWRSPLKWLQAGCEGICPLVRDHRELQRLLLHIHAPVAEDVEHGRELRDTLLRPTWVPQIHIQSLDEPRT
jgi:hypothetical protein